MPSFPATSSAYLTISYSRTSKNFSYISSEGTADYSMWLFWMIKKLDSWNIQLMKMRVVITHASKLWISNVQHRLLCTSHSLSEIVLLHRWNFYLHFPLKPENGVSQNLHSHSSDKKIVMPTVLFDNAWWTTGPHLGRKRFSLAYILEKKNMLTCKIQQLINSIS